MITFAPITNQKTGTTANYTIPNDSVNNFLSFDTRVFNIYSKDISTVSGSSVTIEVGFNVSTLRVDDPSTNVKNVNGKKLR